MGGIASFPQVITDGGAKSYQCYEQEEPPVDVAEQCDRIVCHPSLCLDVARDILAVNGCGIGRRSTERVGTAVSFLSVVIDGSSLSADVSRCEPCPEQDVQFVGIYRVDISKDVLVKQAACLRFVYTVFEDKHRSVFPRTQGVFFYLPVVDGSRDVLFGIGIQAGMGEMLEQFYSFGIVSGGGFAERMIRFLSDTFLACL